MGSRSCSRPICGGRSRRPRSRSRAPDCTILADERLRECNYGELNGTAEPVRDRVAYLDMPYPGGESWRQAVGRVAGFLDGLRLEREGERVLVIGHVATWLALDCAANESRLEEVLGEPFSWQPGWEYVL